MLNWHTTLRVKLWDGVSALGRYYLNNVADSYRQDAIDTMLGNHRGDK